ncbi:MAG: hypothetical protein LBL09_00495 [Oscillospiraceae bacterium]|jgi:hypothetical protein|nr:hypothetical protein [Oscillospiraceae bacterium]
MSTYTPKGTNTDEDIKNANINDYNAIQSYKNAYQEAYASSTRSDPWNDPNVTQWNQKANEIREKYSYSGGADGSEYIPVSSSTPTYSSYYDYNYQPSSFTYSPAPDYQSQYKAQTDALLNEVLNFKDFSYDHEDDPLFQQRKAAYLREGQRSVNNTIGDVAAATGGIASSYAATAAQQSGDYFTSKIADSIPELYSLAYSMYLDGIEKKVKDLGLLQSMDDSQYSRYRDTIGDWRKNLDFAYTDYRNSISDDRYRTEWDYSLGRDDLGDSRYSSETSYNQTLKNAQIRAEYGDFSGYKALGYSDETIAQMKAEYERKNSVTK